MSWITFIDLHVLNHSCISWIKLSLSHWIFLTCTWTQFSSALMRHFEPMFIIETGPSIYPAMPTAGFTLPTVTLTWKHCPAHHYLQSKLISLLLMSVCPRAYSQPELILSHLSGVDTSTSNFSQWGRTMDIKTAAHWVEECRETMISCVNLEFQQNQAF